MSLLVLVVGLVLVAVPNGPRARWLRAAMVAVGTLATVQWVATRDANGPWLVVAAVVAALLARRLGAPPAARRLTVAVAITAVALAAVAAVSVDRGKRWRFPLVNVIAQRVLTDPAQKARFERAGMPDNPSVRCFAGHYASDCQSDFSGFEPWLTARGKQTYARELLTHPGRLVGEPLRHWRALLTGHRFDEASSPPLSFYFYAKPSRAHKLMSFGFGADWGWLTVELVGCLLLLVAARRRLRLDADTAPLVVLGATVYPMMVLVWHGDAMEIQRHALVAIVCLRLALWGAFFVALDRVLGGYSAATAGGTMAATSPSSRSVATSS